MALLRSHGLAGPSEVTASYASRGAGSASPRRASRRGTFRRCGTSPDRGQGVFPGALYAPRRLESRSSRDRAFAVAAPSAVLSKMHHTGTPARAAVSSLAASASRYASS